MSVQYYYPPPPTGSQGRGYSDEQFRTYAYVSMRMRMCVCKTLQWSKNYPKLERHSIEVHNYSRRPFDRLTVYGYRREYKGTATLEQHGC